MERQRTDGELLRDSRTAGRPHRRVLSGAGSFQSAKKSYELKPGSVLLASSGADTIIRASDEWGLEHLVVAWTGTECADLVRDTGIQNNRVYSLENPFPIQMIMEEILTESRKMNARTVDICLNYLRILLHRIAEYSGPELRRGGAFETFVRCRKAMHDHFHRLERPGEVAKLCGLDHAYMTRLFKHYANCTPGRYLTRLKLNKAIHLLTSTDRSIADIATELRFKDPYSFSRSFKRIVGVSPRRYTRFPFSVS